MSGESRSRSASPNPMEKWGNDQPPSQPSSFQPQPTPGGRRRRPPQQQQFQEPPQQQQPQQLQQQPQHQNQMLPAGGGANQALAGPAGEASQLLGNTLGQVTGGGQQSGSGGKDTLKLRLDLNLDVDVQIKARVHGDVTLSLLD